jgi:ligand-binding sensor domain-containing protein
MKFASLCSIILLLFFYSSFIFAEDNWLQIEEINGTKLGCIFSIAVGNDGSIWLASNNGLFRYHEGQGERLFIGQVYEVNIDKENVVWILSDEKLFKNNDGSFLPVIGAPDNLGDFSFAPDNSLWACRFGVGLYCFNGETWELYTVEDGLYSNQVSLVIVDPLGNVWCRYADPLCFECDPNSGIFGGVSCFDGEKWVTYNTANGLVKNNIYSITSNNNRNIYISYGYISYGNERGISRYNGETWETIPMSTQYTGELEVGADGILWCVWNIYLNSYDNNEWKSYTGMPGIIFVYDMKIDKDNTLWFGTENGIIRYRLKTNVENTEIEPIGFKIIGSSPNPFNSSTTIHFNVLQTGTMDISIYSISGQKIKNLIDGSITNGMHSVTWNGRDDYGIKVASGVYIVNLRMNDQSAIHQIMLIK